MKLLVTTLAYSFYAVNNLFSSLTDRFRGFPGGQHRGVDRQGHQLLKKIVPSRSRAATELDSSDDGEKETRTEKSGVLKNVSNLFGIKTSLLF